MWSGSDVGRVHAIDASAQEVIEGFGGPVSTLGNQHGIDPAVGGSLREADAPDGSAFELGLVNIKPGATVAQRTASGTYSANVCSVQLVPFHHRRPRPVGLGNQPAGGPGGVAVAASAGSVTVSVVGAFADGG